MHKRHAAQLCGALPARFRMDSAATVDEFGGGGGRCTLPWQCISIVIAVAALGLRVRRFVTAVSVFVVCARMGQFGRHGLGRVSPRGRGARDDLAWPVPRLVLLARRVRWLLVSPWRDIPQFPLGAVLPSCWLVKWQNACKKICCKFNKLCQFYLLFIKPCSLPEFLNYFNHEGRCSDFNSQFVHASLHRLFILINV